MERITTQLDAFIKFTGESTKWVCSILLVLICIDVIMRYFFNTTQVWVLELEWHLFSIIFLFGGAYTLQKNEHVRVDVFYANWSEKKKALHNLLGIIFLLIPWCIIVVYYGWQYGLNSLSYKEVSPDPGGLPFRFVIKFCIAIGFVLLMIQAISELLKNIHILSTKN